MSAADEDRGEHAALLLAIAAIREDRGMQIGVLTQLVGDSHPARYATLMRANEILADQIEQRDEALDELVAVVARLVAHREKRRAADGER